jgi:diaminopimelate epimerase
MKVPFWKMHGAGNDFILLDHTRSAAWAIPPRQIRAWCQPHTGVGADGLIILQPPQSPGPHFRMQFFNPDGAEASMCGNGARCVARFACDHGIAPSNMHFETGAGHMQATVGARGVTLEMPIPTDIRIGQELRIDQLLQAFDFADTGVPHAILVCPDTDQIDILNLGSAIRRHPHFSPDGTNVDFVQVQPGNRLRIRTYERGVEAETLACGTGVAAAAVVTVCRGLVQSPVQVQTAGGDVLSVSVETKGKTITRLQLTGPAVYVFEGSLDTTDG